LASEYIIGIIFSASFFGDSEIISTKCHCNHLQSPRCHTINHQHCIDCCIAADYNILPHTSVTILLPSSFLPLKRLGRVWISVAGLGHPSRFTLLQSTSRTMVTDTTSTTAVTPTELRLPCADGLNLAALSWKGPAYDPSNADANHHILLGHGWMDNAASFHLLAPALSQAFPQAHIVALDFPGHGHSDHSPPEHPPLVLAQLVYYIRQALQQLQWQPTSTSSHTPHPPVTYIGHSMGAAVGCLFAAAFPESLNRLVLLEGAGPLPRAASDTAHHIRSHLLARENRPTSTRRVYANLQEAVTSRCRTAQTFPGHQWISREAATALVLRGSRPVDSSSTATMNGADDIAANTTTTNNNEPTNNDSPLQFIHDPRLSWPSLQYLTPDQVLGVYDAIHCPTALLLAHSGWPIDTDQYPQQREQIRQRLRPAYIESFPGSHHFHADPETAPPVIQAVIDCVRGGRT
jgi:pimeloyl-ACP methyl ester carboxylesterase